VLALALAASSETVKVALEFPKPIVTVSTEVGKALPDQFAAVFQPLLVPLVFQLTTAIALPLLSWVG
jgi:hypothetical protein